MLRTEDNCDVATSHFWQQEDGAKRSDVNNRDGTNILQHRLFFYLTCQAVNKIQFPVLYAINFISDCGRHWIVKSNRILGKTFFFMSLYFPAVLHVRQCMNYEHFTQVPFDPMLMRSLRFSSVPVILCGNILFFYMLLFSKAELWDLWTLRGRKNSLQQ